MAKAKRSLGESLIEEGIISEAQFKEAQAEEKKTGRNLRTVLVKMGLIAEEDLVTFVSDKLGIPRIELSNYLLDPKIVELLPEALARKYEIVPVLKIGDRLTCAMVDPWNVFALDEVRAKTNLTIEPAVSTQEEIKKALNEYYGAKGSMQDLIKSIEGENLGLSKDGEIDLKKMQGLVEEPIVVKMVNLIIMTAIKDGASDIHVEPEEEDLNIRIRVDGMLHKISAPPKHLQSAIISRIKIMANLDIAERRMPQDGRFSIKVEGKDVDVRVSCMPTIYGENVVLRLLNVASALLPLKDLGFAAQVLERYERLIIRPHGIILVTGPTGSGKTTTLYASINRINTVDKNIITVEDPVEYKLSGIRQTQVNPKVNLTFANGLRSMLRQDPDVVMVGEIRDPETAEISIQAALTGHLVFSTLHTNDAPTAITRLIDMRIEPFLASSSIIGILAQRLVRKICTNCKEKYTPTKEALKDINLRDEKRLDFCKGKGCSKCLNTGYRGRIGIYELLVPDDKIRNAVVSKAPSEEIRRLAVASGMITLMDDGIEKVKQGLTTVEEVLRVTREE